ncbi:MAG: DEAD/DEAH box helicase [Thermoanaerobaculia bacterium]|nr:DEAD/DEAH box helicase [Thermoanaerobaculia bacterium]
MSRVSEELVSRIPPEVLAELSETSLWRGVDYFLRRRVELVEIHGAFLRALVRGTRLYEVQVEKVEEGAYSYYCTCAYFAGSDDACKHIAAALIEAGDPQRQGRSSDFLGRRSSPPTVAPWRSLLAAAAQPALPLGQARPEAEPLCYRLDVSTQAAEDTLRIEVCSVETKRGGSREVGPLRLKRSEFKSLPDPEDRRLVSLLAGGRAAADQGYGSWAGEITLAVDLDPQLAGDVVPLLCRSGRFAVRRKRGEPAGPPLAWNPEGWRFGLTLAAAEEGYELSGELLRGDERRSAKQPVLVTPTLVIDEAEAAPFLEAASLPWLRWFRSFPNESLKIAPDQVDALLGELLVAPGLPALETPDELRVASVVGEPVPGLRIETGVDGRFRPNVATCRVFFRYGADQALLGEPPSAFLVAAAGQRQLVVRNAVLESAHLERLLALGFRSAVAYRSSSGRLEIAQRALPEAIRTLLGEAWEIEIDGTAYRPAEAPRLAVTSGIDWFDITADDEVPGTVPFPLLLQALERGQSQVALPDGTVAVLPGDWLEKNRFWLAAGQRQGEGLRFSAAQAALVEAWLEDEEAVDYDAAFGQLTARLAAAPGPAEAPAGFVGVLREYQREGLAWLEHLSAAGLGGCLADDMGLGKTIQLLAFLVARPRSAGFGPSLVVAPKTLVDNWCAEAARFTPSLVVHAHGGAARAKSAEAFAAADVVITSYDLLRRDLALFGAIRWQTVVLDEAQAIKNKETATAKAARRLTAAFRVAATGTPVENHLGELWSLFEFLNPGLLGRALLGSKAGGRDLPEDVRTRLARGLRPFLLRRTKAQVAPDLPPKTEQTVWCELELAQRRLYDELRDHYRAALTQRVAKVGMKRSAIQVLEALLRLRQAACHPGLLDRRGTLEATSAKFDELLPRLAELREEGHKALVFSQFTSLLALLRRELDKTGVVYEYLDGQTEDRGARVERFQTDPDCPLFLISLKAGGFGLNLTAAEYVFLLDPWWNPAVEAQAIDRTHRIGQERPVFAYRLIAKNTVEERILELQAKKRELADAIFAADASPLASLTREDLELLFE